MNVVIDGKSFEVQDEVSDLIHMISLERDALKAEAPISDGQVDELVMYDEFEKAFPKAKQFYLKDLFGWNKYVGEYANMYRAWKACWELLNKD